MSRTPKATLINVPRMKTQNGSVIVFATSLRPVWPVVLAITDRAVGIAKVNANHALKPIQKKTPGPDPRIPTDSCIALSFAMQPPGGRLPAAVDAESEAVPSVEDLCDLDRTPIGVLGDGAGEEDRCPDRHTQQLGLRVVRPLHLQCSGCLPHSDRKLLLEGPIQRTPIAEPVDIAEAAEAVAVEIGVEGGDYLVPDPSHAPEPDEPCLGRESEADRDIRPVGHDALVQDRHGERHVPGAKGVGEALEKVDRHLERGLGDDG